MKESNEEKDSSYYEVVREQLRYWPYTVHQIDDTLDIGLIEGRGRQLLFQAINAENLTAFVGSGLSAAYGRLSWSDWEIEQFSVVEVGSKSFESLADASIELISLLEQIVAPEIRISDSDKKKYAYVRNELKILDERGVSSTVKFPNISERENIWHWLKASKREVISARKHVERLRQTFLRSRSDSGDFPGGEALPLKFQISQKLHEELRKHIVIFLKPLGSENCINNDYCWFGTSSERESAAPEDALELLRKFLENDHIATDDAICKVNEYRDSHFFPALKNYRFTYDRQQAQVSSQMLAKMLLVDERAHAMITLRSGLFPGIELSDYDDEKLDKISNLEEALNIYQKDSLKRDLDGIRNDTELYRVLSPFDFKVYKNIENSIESKHKARWGDLFYLIKKHLEKYKNKAEKSGDKRSYLSPTSRYLVATYLSLVKNSWELVGYDSKTKKITSDSVLFKPIERSSFTSRRSIIANRFDPLAKTVRQLGISQYITTNYDFEIERFFQDVGYRKFSSLSPSQAAIPGREPRLSEYRTDPIGGLLVDQSFDRERAAELVAFGISNASKDASVFHLHGRATRDENLVITERDYMNLYLLEDKNRDTVNEAITMAFSSSPLIFLGLGMSEVDLLRPLRQFMSNRDRTIGYHAVALLPAEKPIEARTKFSVTCYLRYGVHTIFYGSGRIEIDVNERKNEYGIDWLCRIILLIEAIGDELKSENESDEFDDELTIFTRLVKKVSFVGDDIVGYPKKNTFAFFVLFGMLVSKGDDEFDGDATQKIIQNNYLSIKEKKKILKNCWFTPIRPVITSKFSRHFDEDVVVNSDKYLELETQILNEIMLVVLKFAGVKRKNLDREIEAAKITLNGLKGAFLTGSLNAQLDGLEKEWRSWWKNWQQSPPHRVARFQKLKEPYELGVEQAHKSREVDFYPVRFVRHRVDSIITNTERLERIYCPDRPSEKCNDGVSRIKQDFTTGIRAFDTFILAVDTIDRKKYKYLSYKRLLLTIAAYRGLGKGTLLTAMSTRLGLSMYSQAAWESSGPGEFKPFIAAAAFVNLSFATEIASTYDMLLDALMEVCAALICAEDKLCGNPNSEPLINEVARDLADTFNPELTNESRKYFFRNNKSPANKKYEEFRQRLVGVSRLRSLEIMFDELKNISLRISELKGVFGSRGRFGRPRLLIYLSGTELLYNSGVEHKNGEISQFLKLLYSEKLDKHPIDIITVGSEQGLGAPFSLKNRPFRQIQLSRNDIHARAKEQIKQRILEGRIELDDVDGYGNEISLKEMKNESGDVPTNFVHFARPASPASLLADNFPVLATALYLQNPPPQNEGDNKCSKSSLQILKDAFDVVVRSGRDCSDNKMSQLWKTENEEIPEASELDFARKQVWKFVVCNLRPALILFDASNGDTDLTQKQEFIDISDDADVDAKVEYSEESKQLQEILRKRLKEPNSLDREEWRLVRRHLGYNRFSTTILMAAAEHMVIHSESASHGGQVAEEFIRTTIDQVRNYGRLRREQFVLQAVLDCYRRYHVIGDSDLDIEFHQLILRHLGSIGSPIGSSVLIRMPKIREYFVNLGVELEVSRRRYLTRALTVLAYRGLIFRLDPHPRLLSLAKNPEGKVKRSVRLDFRYALHRNVQRFAIANLGIGKTDPIRINSFAPRLYTAMPSVGAGLSQESFGFLRSLLVSLSQYPDVPDDDNSLQPWLFHSGTTNEKVQALRAALSLSRSTLSVATLSRFVDMKDNEPGYPRLGLLEAYKVRLRWIIRMSWEVVEPEQVEKLKRSPKAELDHTSALYRDEIVWLYNELGVISLTQGNLTEALGFLRQSAELNEDVEGRSRLGPIYDYIDLNHAIVQLERGRFISATRRLLRVRGSEPYNSTLKIIAEGYLCLIAHIEGQFEGLQGRFASVTKSLQEKEQTRASSIFLSHRARYLASDNPDSALDELSVAQALAETGGHEDIRHHIEIARIAVTHRYQSKIHNDRLDNMDSLEKLRNIENYGRRMGIWSLQIDALKLRAEKLLAQGETSTAGSLVVRAMAIAKRNSMKLRLNSALTIYAEILLSRGDVAGARQHAMSSLDMAKSTGYSLETSRAQRVLNAVDPTV